MLSYQALFQNRGRVAVVERSDPTEPWIPGARFTRLRPPMTTTRHLKQNLVLPHTLLLQHDFRSQAQNHPRIEQVSTAAWRCVVIPGRPFDFND